MNLHEHMCQSEGHSFKSLGEKSHPRAEQLDSTDSAESPQTDVAFQSAIFIPSCFTSSIHLAGLQVSSSSFSTGFACFASRIKTDSLFDSLIP